MMANIMAGSPGLPMVGYPYPIMNGIIMKLLKRILIFIPNGNRALLKTGTFLLMHNTAT